MPDVFTAPKEEKAEPSTPISKSSETSVKEVEEIISGNDFHNPLAAYMYKPNGIHFETKHATEEVILFLRKHPITNVPWILIAIVMSLAPLVLPNFPIIAFLPPNFQLVAVIAWYLITFAFVLENFLIWFFNVSIMTNIRIVDIDFNNLLYKEVSDAEIEHIEDVTYKMAGAIRTIFNYGDVLVQTASEVPNFDFLAVPKPDQVVKALQKLRERHGKSAKFFKK